MKGHPEALSLGLGEKGAGEDRVQGGMGEREGDGGREGASQEHPEEGRGPAARAGPGHLA